ncbi:MAG: outer membrane lipoprotein chaperone LolA [Acidiferrobacterales bacterium]
MKKFVSVWVVALLCAPLTAMSTNDPLQRFFNDVYSYQATFKQVVLDEGLNTLQESSGTLWIERPNKFRWDYEIPFKQHIIGDGKQIWVYDEELEQVTVRQMKGALGYTPAILLAGGGNLTDNFTLKKLSKQGKLQWMEMIPKKNDGGFEDIRLGFEGNILRQLEMVDGFGQTTRITMSNNRENNKIRDSLFHFTPPKGVSVIRQ